MTKRRGGAGQDVGGFRGLVILGPRPENPEIDGRDGFRDRRQKRPTVRRLPLDSRDGPENDDAMVTAPVLEQVAARRGAGSFAPIQIVPTIALIAQ